MDRYAGRTPREVVNQDVFPHEASLRQRLTYLLNYAVLAPSSHNSQPWQFKVEEDAVELYADRNRSLPVADPRDRELIMSCGAALFSLRVAMLRYGLVPRVRILPKPHIADLLARVEVDSMGKVDTDVLPLFEAIPRRHTNRGPFENRAIPISVRESLSRAAERESASARFIHEADEKANLARLIAEADRAQGRDPEFRRELAEWVHPDDSGALDGIPGYAMGREGLASYAGPLLIRTFDWGNQQAAKDQQIAKGSPLLMALWTFGDDASAWLDAGQALAHVLLAATAEGVSASFLNQPVEVDETREALRRGLVLQRHPQALLRLGYGSPIRPTPRRSVADVLLESALHSPTGGLR